MEQYSQLSALGLFDARVPRYTSYPTSPHFSNDVTGETYQQWVERIPEGSRISLYVHVPFCRRLCWFCACRTQGTRNMATVDRYLDVLRREIELLRTVLPDGVRLSRLHWGGGTPTLLGPDMIDRLAYWLNELAPLAEDAEFSVEIDPNEIDTDRMDALAAAGMTRASIGIQDFDPDIQKMIGRSQSFDLTRDVTDALRARGIQSVNADIVYGLPNQSPERLTQSIQRVLALSPDRVALFGYAHVPWMARRQAMIPTDSLPDPEERLVLFETARRLFLWDGYREIGIDHFARPEDGLSMAADQGTLRRNFQGYTDDAAPILIGLGASAISRLPDGYAQNASGTGDYAKRITSDSLATARGHRFVGEDRTRAYLIEKLMCEFAIDLARAARDCGSTTGSIRSLLAPVASEFGEFVRLTADRFDISRQGRPLTRMIAQRLDAYVLEATRHSAAI